MNAKTLKDLFMSQLADIYDAEQRIVIALPKLAKAATSDDLKETFLSHLKETEGHVTKLEAVFRLFSEPVKGKTCEATVGLLVESDGIVAEFGGSPAGDAALISAAQKAGEVHRREQPDVIARHIFFVYSASLRWWIASPKPDPRHGIADLRRLLRLLVAGLR